MDSYTICAASSFAMSSTKSSIPFQRGVDMEDVYKRGVGQVISPFFFYILLYYYFFFFSFLSFLASLFLRFFSATLLQVMGEEKKKRLRFLSFSLCVCVEWALSRATRRVSRFTINLDDGWWNASLFFFLLRKTYGETLGFSSFVILVILTLNSFFLRGHHIR